ncbi:CapA family protein [Gemelliphila palaticanis]|uniref:CapA family protein n=1 Tax=Gemelliphila palaticanis TaxID=81950 RepID=A0ABX2SZ50_9BACL|nr:CapA family protein [Gemella palaticanis]MBF0715402.1 CapA family protein [Gemella palaticanis]NYS47332.1 CapA family protein [Gemella palaticanis]
MKGIRKFLLVFIPVVIISLSVSLYVYSYLGGKDSVNNAISNIFGVNNVEKEKQSSHGNIQTAHIVANGDILYHDVLYWSAQTEQGYDFNPYFEYVKDRISEADLAIGDYEGTISDKHPLTGYPLFNAPKETAQSMKDVGYDVVDLAHNHILDTGLYGLKYTYNEFKNLGLTPIGVHVEKSRDEADITIKEINGIKIALLAYSYGFNGLESGISKADYNYHLSDLQEEKIKKDLEKAESMADVTVVMPQMGVEYRLQPTEEQKTLYNKMLNWGADVVLGGHPHVVEPAEVVEINGDKKLIIYSMGNFISNQTVEMMRGLGVVSKWPERGVLMDIVFEKNNGKTIIKTAEAKPTLVVAEKNGKTYKNGYPLYNYRVLVLEDFLEGGKYYGKYNGEIQNKIETTYKEMNEHVGLKW